MHKLIFLIGASGAGKTTTAKALEKENIPDLQICYFDSVGVPSNEEIIRDYGSIEEWQRIKTIRWAQKIKDSYLDNESVVLDTQTRPSFIHEAIDKADIADYEVLLFDCSNDVRKKRLEGRNQPELASEQMANWATYLREQCKEYEYDIVDTSTLTVKECVTALKGAISKD